MRPKPNPCPKCGQRVKVITKEEKKKGAWYVVVKCYNCGFKRTAWQQQNESVKVLANRAIEDYNRILY